MSLGSILKAVGDWFAKICTTVENTIAPAAVMVVEAVKSLDDAGILSDIAVFLGGKLPGQIVLLVHNALPKILADLLAIEGVPANATPADIQAFTDKVIASFASMDFQKKSAAYTNLAYQVYTLIQNQVEANAGKPLSFAQIIALIEAGYQDYKEAVANPTTN